MRRLPFLIVFCSSVLAIGCASQPSTEFHQKIVGSWILDQSVMGEHTQELLEVHSDGSFSAKVLFKNGIGMVGQFIEQGEWAIIGNDIEFSTKRRNGKEFSSDQTSPDRRVIKLLDDNVFVIADKKFGIELRRMRAPADYKLPGWDERLMDKIAK